MLISKLLIAIDSVDLALIVKILPLAYKRLDNGAGMNM